MSHSSYQIVEQIIVFGIVAAAFYAVGSRLWSQVAAFRSRPRRRMPAAAKSAPAPQASPLIQLQTKPPAHLKRPPPEH